MVGLLDGRFVCLLDFTCLVWFGDWLCFSISVVCSSGCVICCVVGYGLGGWVLEVGLVGLDGCAYLCCVLGV